MTDIVSFNNSKYNIVSVITLKLCAINRERYHCIYQNSDSIKNYIQRNAEVKK